MSKFTEHLPLYRQQDILSRHGVFFSRSTLCGWLEQTAKLFRPLYELLRSEVLKSYVIQADETPVPVFDPTRDATRTGYLWGKRGDAEHPYVVYDYSDSRSRDGPAEFFKDYRGYLQTDAYVVYESVVDRSKGRIIAVGCWAHVSPGVLRCAPEPAARGALRAGIDRSALRDRGRDPGPQRPGAVAGTPGAECADTQSS